MNRWTTSYITGIVIVGIFIFYNFILYNGVKYFGIEGAPLVLLFAAMILPIMLLKRVEESSADSQSIAPMWHSIMCIAIVLGGFLYYIEPLTHVFSLNPLPTQNSDVLPQLTWQYERFWQGLQPYVPAETVHYKPFPVYMPLHWLPLSISDLLNIDARWSGIILLGVASMIFAWEVGKSHIPLLAKVTIALLPLSVIYWPLSVRIEDVNTVFETVVAAYYLILAAGFISKKEGYIIAGILGAMLTRYTILFWLPMAFAIVYHKEGSKKAIRITSWVIGGIIVLYVIPFLLRDWTIFKQGLEYHNKCAILDWQSMDGGNIPWIFNEGTSYIQYYYKMIDAGDPQRSVFILRTIQLIAMALINVLGYAYYYHNSKHIDIYPYLLGLLTLTIIVFYATSPLAFGYYWFCVTILLVGCVVWMARKVL